MSLSYVAMMSSRGINSKGSSIWLETSSTDSSRRAITATPITFVYVNVAVVVADVMPEIPKGSNSHQICKKPVQTREAPRGSKISVCMMDRKNSRFRITA